VYTSDDTDMHNLSEDLHKADLILSIATVLACLQCYDTNKL